MTPRLIDNYCVILLDVSNTFMFETNRFEDPAGIARTYAAQGGVLLNAEQVAGAIAALFTAGLGYARNPDFYDRFPPILDMLRDLPETAALPEDELHRLVRVFALHERGFVPPEYAATLRQLGETYRLGVVSNIWAPSNVFFEAFEQAGITDLFDVVVFSSDVGAIKPSPVLFDKALGTFDVPRDRIVHVGDSFKRDVAGARAVGIDTVWISSDTEIPEGYGCRPNLIVKDLAELVQDVS